MKTLEQGYRPTDKLDRSKPPQGGSAVSISLKNDKWFNKRMFEAFGILPSDIKSQQFGCKNLPPRPLIKPKSCEKL